MALEQPFFDEVHYWTLRPPKTLGLPSEAEKELTRYREVLNRARRFVIDDTMLSLVVQVSQNIERLPLWIDLARLPFDECWFELDDSVRVAALGKSRTFDEPPESGFLFIRERASASRWVAINFRPVDDQPRQYGAVWPGHVAIVVDPEATEEHPVGGGLGHLRLSREFNSVRSHVEYAAMGIEDGLTGRIIAPDWCKDRLAVVCEPINRLNFHARKKEARDRAEFQRRYFETYLLDNRGIARFLITLLAVINDVPTVQAEVQPRSGFQTIRNHRIPYLSHSVVRIKAPKTRPVEWLDRKLMHAHGIRRRAHEVRGHWRTIYDRSTGEMKYRRWIAPHMRGDASLGYVRHVYRVSPKKDQSLPVHPVDQDK